MGQNLANTITCLEDDFDQAEKNWVTIINELAHNLMLAFILET
jgi:hypothetical protein